MRRLVLLLLVFFALPCAAQDAPQSPVEVSTVQRAPAVYAIQAVNRWEGPVEVRVKLSAQSSNVVASPALPAQWVLTAHQTMVLSTIKSADPTRPGNFALEVEAVPGSPLATHNPNTPYAWPLPNGAGRIDQGFGGQLSHFDAENYYAIDITAPLNTPVLAARAGLVMATEDRFTQGGLDPALKTRTNYVRILHEDGTMGVYVHLAPHSLRVVAGQRVITGQPLASLGGVGYASGPHLHFAVQQNINLSLHAIPFKMFQPKNAASGLVVVHPRPLILAR